jgi:hypothetical protein
VHSLAAQVEAMSDLGTREAKLRVTQLDSAERRTLLIVRALTCFYLAVSSFVASTLVSLFGAIAAGLGRSTWLQTGFTLGIAAGSVGVASMMTGALLLVRETRFSYRVLKQENEFITSRVRERSHPPTH